MPKSQSSRLVATSRTATGTILIFAIREIEKLRESPWATANSGGLAWVLRDSRRVEFYSLHMNVQGAEFGQNFIVNTHMSVF